MSISTDLFLAILSMDAYNREYGAGVDIAGDSIGSALVIDRTSIGIGEPEYEAWQSAGFYAASYEVQAGEQVDGLDAGQTIIAYRGTDNRGLFGGGETGSDFWNGWITGAGFAGSQADLAFDFFHDVTGSDAFLRESGDVILTGHSLGGGLAGVVAALSGDEGVVFDNMPFGSAATNAAGIGWTAAQLCVAA